MKILVWNRKWKLKNDKKYLDLLTKEAKDNDWSHKAKVIIDYIKKDEKWKIY